MGRGELISLKEICVRFGVTPLRVRRWVSAGAFPRPVCLGGGRRWRRADVERVARAGTPPR